MTIKQVGPFDAAEQAYDNVSVPRGHDESDRDALIAALTAFVDACSDEDAMRRHVLSAENSYNNAVVRRDAGDVSF